MPRSVMQAERSWSSRDGEPCGNEVAVSSQLLEAQLDPTGQERRAATEGHWCDRNDHLVQQPGVGELAGQVSTADDPDVAVACGLDHLLVHRRDVPARELDWRIGDDGQLA